MKKINKEIWCVPTLLLVALIAWSYAYAATSPSLGIADTFGILSSTYTNTVAGTTINGDLGYTTAPAFSPTVNGTTHVADSTYIQAGSDQGTALASLNTQACTHTFAPGAVDLASNADFPTGIYPPGVYCITGAASVGAGGITLDGSGTHIFRMTTDICRAPADGLPKGEWGAHLDGDMQRPF